MDRPREDEPDAKKKRGAEKGLSQEDIDGREDTESNEEIPATKEFAKADAETLSKRKIVKARRKGSSALEPENANQNPELPAPTNTGFIFSSTPSEPKKSEENGEKASEKKEVEKKEEKNEVSNKTPENKEVEKKETPQQPAESSETKETSSEKKPEEEKKEEEKKEGENKEGEKKEEEKKGPFGFFTVSSPFSFGSTSSSPFSAFSTPTSTFNFSTSSTFGAAYSAGSSFGNANNGEENADPSEFAPTSSYAPVVSLPVPSEPVSTGEEGEDNVFTSKLSKLYGLEENSWKERGEGTLKVNVAKDGSYSRILLRTAGILALKLNTRVWASMTVEKVGAKQVRFQGTAMEKTAEVVPFLLRFREPSDTDAFVSVIEAQKKKLAAKK